MENLEHLEIKHLQHVCENNRQMLTSTAADKREQLATTLASATISSAVLRAKLKPKEEGEFVSCYDDRELIDDLNSVYEDLCKLPPGMWRRFYLGTLGIALHRHFEKTHWQDKPSLAKSATALQLAIQPSAELQEVAGETSRDLVPGIPLENTRTLYICALGDVKQKLYKVTRETHYLDEAIQLLEDRWADTTDRGPDAVTSGLVLIECYTTKWSRYGHVNLTHKGMLVLDEILRLELSPSCRVQAVIHRCGFRLQQAFAGEIDDTTLSQTIEVAESIRPQIKNVRSEPGHMDHLTHLYMQRSIRSSSSDGRYKDIESAFQVARDAVKIADEMTVGRDITENDILIARARARSSLGLYYRYHNSGHTAFLQEAARLGAESTALSGKLGIHDPNHIIYGHRLAHLRCILFLRQIGDVSGLTESINWIRKMLLSLDLSRFGKEDLKCNLCCCLCTRYDSDPLRYANDSKELIEIVPKIRDNHNRDDLMMLAQMLGMVYRRNNNKQLLELIIACASPKRFLPPEDGCDNSQEPASEIPTARLPPRWLTGLGPQIVSKALLHRSALEHGDKWSDDAAAALGYLQQYIHVKSAPPEGLIQATMLLFRPVLIYSGKIDLSFLASATKEAVRLLPRVVSRALTREDVKLKLRMYTGIGSMAAASALAAGHSAEDALEFVESSRGLLATYLMDARADMLLPGDSQHQSEGERVLRARLTHKVSELEAARAGDWNLATTTPCMSTAYKLDSEIEQTLKQLHARAAPQPRSHLLQPPGIGNGAVVIVNASFRCDAIIIYQQKIWSLPLPILREEIVEIASSVLKRIRTGDTGELGKSPFHPNIFSSTVFLGWLWVAAVEPILRSLGFTSTPSSTKDWPRVWWVPTGILSQFPFHAAGFYNLGSTSSALDRVVSSYSSSVKSLLFTSQNVQNVRGGQAPQTKPDPMVVVPMENTKGLRSLPFAGEEARTIETVLGQSVKFHKLSQPSKKDVLRELGSCNIFHFAGHGKSSAEDPDRGCLCLDDWQSNPLTVRDLLSLELHRRPPWLAYLSACSTGVNHKKELRDEAIHLVAACQLAGFQHVVGSFWEVADSQSQKVAKLFYTSLKGSGIGEGNDVAFALHTAVRELRREAESSENGATAPLGRTSEGSEDDVAELDEAGGGSEADVERLLQDLRDASSCCPADEDWDGVRNVSYVIPESVQRGNRSIDPMIWAPYFHVGL